MTQLSPLLRDWQIARMMFGANDKKLCGIVKRMRKLAWQIDERFGEDSCVIVNGEEWWWIPLECVYTSS